MKRAERRRSLLRMKVRAREYYWFCKNPDKLANHLANCSCPACGNPRRHFGTPTRQEQKKQQDGWD